MKLIELQLVFCVAQDDLCPHQFARVFPVVFQNLRPPSQTGDYDGVSHQQSSPLCCQLNLKSTTWDTIWLKWLRQGTDPPNIKWRWWLNFSYIHLLIEVYTFTSTWTHTCPAVNNVFRAVSVLSIYCGLADVGSSCEDAQSTPFAVINGRNRLLGVNVNESHIGAGIRYSTLDLHLLVVRKDMVTIRNQWRNKGNIRICVGEYEVF